MNIIITCCNVCQYSFNEAKQQVKVQVSRTKFQSSIQRGKQCLQELLIGLWNVLKVVVCFFEFNGGICEESGLPMFVLHCAHFKRLRKWSHNNDVREQGISKRLCVTLSWQLMRVKSTLA